MIENKGVIFSRAGTLSDSIISFIINSTPFMQSEEIVNIKNKCIERQFQVKYAIELHTKNTENNNYALIIL